jgi:hypothetical protein
VRKTIRVWNGATVVALIDVDANGITAQGAVGAAADSTKVDIEIDPWAGLIVDHSTRKSPVNDREEQS